MQKITSFHLISSHFIISDHNYLKTSNSQHDWMLVKYLNIFHHNRTQKQLRHFFFLAKIYPSSYFRYFGHVWSLPSKTIMPTCRNFDVYLHAKNELHSWLLFWDIVKILQICYFEYFENAWSCPSIIQYHLVRESDAQSVEMNL